VIQPAYSTLVYSSEKAFKIYILIIAEILYANTTKV